MDSLDRREMYRRAVQTVLVRMHTEGATFDNSIAEAVDKRELGTTQQAYFNGLQGQCYTDINGDVYFETSKGERISLDTCIELLETMITFDSIPLE